MLQVRNLCKAYGPQVLFEDASFLLERGERVGVIGRNGHGKSTLFRILLGQEEPDSGAVVLPRDYRLGHLAQELRFGASTVLGEAIAALPLDEHGVAPEHRAEATLQGLGFERPQFDLRPDQLSGGFQVRLQLARVLLSAPDLLLLDEPTNYLDIVSLRWLRRFLREWRGELLLISHDREFLDSITTHTLAIHRARVRKVAGATTKVLGQLALEEEVHEKTRLNLERERRQAERFIDRFRAKASKARVVQSRIKQLDKKEQLDQLDEIPDLSFSFRAAPFPARVVLQTEAVAYSYGAEAPRLFENLSLEIGAEDRIGIIGPNGRGKSTLVSVLAGERAPVAGQVRPHPAARIAYYGQGNVDRLDPERTVEEEILAVHPDHSRTDARGICGLMMFEGKAGVKPIAVLSGGERCRVLLGKLLVSPANLLLLDEPTNHLDMQAMEGLGEALAEFPGAVVIVTHSEMLLHALATRLVVFDGGCVRIFEGTYQDFLDQIGWAGEAVPEGRADPGVRARNRRELRRQRAEIVAEKSTVVRPLERQVAQLEDEITRLEQETAALNERLVAAATTGASAEIPDLARRAREVQTRLAALLDDYERAGTALATATADFAARLAELEDAGEGPA